MDLSSAFPSQNTDTPQASDWWVVCLCANWCGTCREYRPLFDGVAAEHPGMRFVWVDVEDESDLVGDLDVETFPTLLISDGSHARFLGALLPQASVLVRLLQSLQEKAGAAPVGVEAQAVFEAIANARKS